MVAVHTARRQANCGTHTRCPVCCTECTDTSINPLTPTVAIWVQPDRLKLSFIICDIRALWRCFMATVGIKGLSERFNFQTEYFIIAERYIATGHYCVCSSGIVCKHRRILSRPLCRSTAQTIIVF